MSQNNINPRRAALNIIFDVLEKDVFYDRKLHKTFEENEHLTKKDKSFIKVLSGGTVERCIELDYLIDRISKIPVKKQKPVIRNILRMTAYQILYMDVPDSAAVNESVKLTGKFGMNGLKGFVNGISRNMAKKYANPKDIIYPDKSSMRDYLSIKYSMPLWITSMLCDSYGDKKTEKILSSFYTNDKRICVHTDHRIDKDILLKKWDENGITYDKGRIFEDAYYLSGYESIEKIPGFAQGEIQIQAEGCGVISAICGIKEKDTVIDVCAAPGGKSVQASEYLGSNGSLICCDISEKKQKLIKENMVRHKVDNVKIYDLDARERYEDFIETADVVIADVPCSGLGVMGNKCDIKYHTKVEDIEALNIIQKDIIKNVIEYIKPGGTLVYSTCTMGRKENEDMVSWMEEELDMRPVSIEDRLPDALKGRTGEKGYISILPDDGTDGFFAACLSRG